MKTTIITNPPGPFRWRVPNADGKTRLMARDMNRRVRAASKAWDSIDRISRARKTGYALTDYATPGSLRRHAMPLTEALALL